MAIPGRKSFEIDCVDSHWDAWVDRMTGKNGGMWFRCMWPVEGAQMNVCGYQAKRSLVQRHVENKHLKIRCVNGKDQGNEVGLYCDV